MKINEYDPIVEVSIVLQPRHIRIQFINPGDKESKVIFNIATSAGARELARLLENAANALDSSP